MNYGNIPEKILNVELGECYNNGALYVRNQIDDIGESVEFSEWELTDNEDIIFPKLKNMTVWTENYIMVLVNSPVAEQEFITVKRNPTKNA